jgi:exopolysaccharide biosynthesis polyprenyl glycosylphosphotransferase
VAVADAAALPPGGLRRLAWSLEHHGIDLVVAPGLTEVAGPRIVIRPMAGLPLLHVDQARLSGGAHLVGEAAGRVAAAAGLVVLAPVFVTVAAAVRLTSRGPALFRQTRIGRHGEPFTLCKFRTMHERAEDDRHRLIDLNETDGLLFKVRRDPRVTPVGRVLRRFSVDELPQLWNVVRGDMSLVGPRPPLPDEVARYDGDLRRRLLVKPGLTGLWQVSGRSDLSWDESVRLDLYYVENWSLTLDLLILLRTVASVLVGRGAY